MLRVLSGGHRAILRSTPQSCLLRAARHCSCWSCLSFARSTYRWPIVSISDVSQAVRAAVRDRTAVHTVRTIINISLTVQRAQTQNSTAIRISTTSMIAIDIRTTQRQVRRRHIDAVVARHRHSCSSNYSNGCSASRAPRPPPPAAATSTRSAAPAAARVRHAAASSIQHGAKCTACR